MCETETESSVVLAGALAAVTGAPADDPDLRAACAALVAVLTHGYGQVTWQIHAGAVTLRPEPRYRLPPPTLRRGPT